MTAWMFVDGYVEVEAKRLRGATIVLDVPTVTGCENLLMAAALAKGRTVIENAAREPEVEELALVLNKMGAKIQGGGTAIITIEGVDELQPIEHAIIPDRIEAGTAVAALGGVLSVILMYVLFLPLSFLIPSSSGLATVAMPTALLTISWPR